MLVREICRLGYFDKVIVDGYMLPLYNDLGIEIKHSQSIMDAIEENTQAFSHNVARLRINIAGESLNNELPNDIIRMRRHREKELNLKRCCMEKIDRYYIGYVDIFIVKGNNKIEETENCYKNIQKISKNEYEYTMLTTAVSIQQRLLKENKELLECNIAIVDKVYVQINFRRCGISSWIHNNLHELIKIYGMLDTVAVILMPGDFNNESKKMFNMTKDEYEQMLTQHYKNVGYKQLQNNVMYRQFLKSKKILGLI